MQGFESQHSSGDSRPELSGDEMALAEATVHTAIDRSLDQFSRHVVRDVEDHSMVLELMAQLDSDAEISIVLRKYDWERTDVVMQRVSQQNIGRVAVFAASRRERQVLRTDEFGAGSPFVIPDLFGRADIPEDPTINLMLSEASGLAAAERADVETTLSETIGVSNQPIGLYAAEQIADLLRGARPLKII